MEKNDKVDPKGQALRFNMEIRKAKRVKAQI
jgi:hypothetical protein